MAKWNNNSVVVNVNVSGNNFSRGGVNNSYVTNTNMDRNKFSKKKTDNLSIGATNISNLFTSLTSGVNNGNTMLKNSSNFDTRKNLYPSSRFTNEKDSVIQNITNIISDKNRVCNRGTINLENKENDVNVENIPSNNEYECILVEDSSNCLDERSKSEREPLRLSGNESFQNFKNQNLTNKNSKIDKSL